MVVSPFWKLRFNLVWLDLGGEEAAVGTIAPWNPPPLRT